MPLRSSEEVNEVAAGPNAIAGLATPSSGARDVMVWRTRVPAGAATPPHKHDREEVCVFTEGRGVAREGGDTLAVAAGDVLIVPSDVVHEVRADDASTLTWI